MKEHKDGCAKCLMDKSAIAEHAWTNDHPINWAGTKILQHVSRTMQLVLKKYLAYTRHPKTHASTETADKSYLTVGLPRTIN